MTSSFERGNNLQKQLAEDAQSSAETLRTAQRLASIVDTLIKENQERVKHGLPGAPNADILYLRSPDAEDGTSASVHVSRLIDNPTQASITIYKQQRAIPVSPSILSYHGKAESVEATFWGDLPDERHLEQTVPYVPRFEEVDQMGDVLAKAFATDEDPLVTDGLRALPPSS